MRRTFTCLCLIFAALTGYSQPNLSSVRGIVTDERGEFASAITVALLSAKDSLGIRSVITDSQGSYTFKSIQAGKYLLLFTATGYKKHFTQVFELAAGSNKLFETTQLTAVKYALNEVIIRDRKNYIDVRADKTILNVDRNILATGASVLSLLTNAPGLRINAAGDIRMRAGQEPAILLNGKRINLHGQDLTSYLQSLQSADISQVELIANPSAKYDGTGAGGIISLITKKSPGIGLNGTITATAGYGRFGKAGLSFTGNYRTKKINVFGGGGFDYNKTFLDIITARTVNDPQQTGVYSDYYNTSKNPKFNYRLGADFFLDSLNTLGLLVYGSTVDATFAKLIGTQITKNAIPDTNLTTLSDLKRRIDNPDFNLNYQRLIGKHQTLSADADVFLYRRKIEEEFLVYRQRATAATSLSRVDTLQNVAPTKITNVSFKLDYSNQLSKIYRLEAGVKRSSVNSDNEQFFDRVTKNIYIPIIALTSHFNYKEYISAAYTNLAYSGKDFSYNAGLRFENFKSDADLASDPGPVKRNYNNFFPAVQVVFKPGNSQWTLDYNRRADYLDYSILNPIVRYQDSYYYDAGNSYLRPAYTNAVQLGYGYKSVFKIAFASVHTTDLFRFSYFIQNDATKVLVVARTNLKSVSQNGIIIDIPGAVSDWYTFNFHADLSRQHYKDYQGLLDKGNKDLIFNLDQSFKVKNAVLLSLTGHYESSTFYGISNFKPNYFLSGGASWQLSPVAALTFSVTDMFNTDRDRYRTDFNNVNLTGRNKRESQVFRLSYAYRFGKKTIKAARKHGAGNTDEQRRMNSGNN